MEGIWSSTVEAYDNAMAQADPRSEGWFMVGSPFPGFFLTIGYIFLVEYALPKYMKNRDPYELRRVMMVYNFAMVALSGYVFFEFGMGGWFTNYTFGCQLCDYSRSPQAMRMLNACWWYYISKYMEYIDTFIFCLRKKTNQVSFLHVYHHALMPFGWYFGVKFGGGGIGTFSAWCNTFIHFLMYTYYGVASLGSEYQKFLWWKKYMTKMQILQFVLVLIHTSQIYFTDCSYSPAFGHAIFSGAVIFLVLFGKFYVKSYLKSHRKPQKEHVSNGKVTNGTACSNGKVTNGTAYSNGNVTNGSAYSNGKAYNNNYHEEICVLKQD